MCGGKKLRREILKLRDGIPEAERKKKSHQVSLNVFQLEEVKKAETIFIYVSFRSEVDTREIIKKFLQQGKEVLVPVTLLKEKKLLAVPITDPDHDLKPGYCSIPEPKEKLRQNKRDGSDIDMIFLPGSVFDERGGRLGYGGGYYDRFLSLEAPRAFKVGLAFEKQLIKKAPLQKHDELLDIIITEERVVSSL